MSKYQAYPKYKIIGSKWVSEIPVNWESILFKRVVSEIKDGTHGTYARVIEGVPFLSAKNVINDGVKIGNSESMISEKDYLEITGNGFPRKGDLLITCVGTIGRTCVYEFEEAYAFQRSVAFLRLSKLAEPKFYKYFVESKTYQSQLIAQSKASAQSGVYMGDLVSTSTVLPPLNEQQKIANFLDHETAKIDTLIEKQQQLIKLLKEKRQAVISHAVTKGLNPNAPMRDSGVEWLGEVPEHWSVCLIKYKCEEITDGAHVSPETEGGGHYFVSITDVKKGVINFENALQTTSESYQYLIKTGCMPFAGDILFSKDGTIGQTAITPDNVDFVVASSLIIIRPNRKKIKPQYLNFLLQSGVVIEQVESFVKGAALRRLSIQNLLKIWGTFPPIDEQDKICEYLLETLSQYDGLEKQANDLIILLKERRTALISAAVTGKIDVRNWLAPEPSNTNNKDVVA